MLTLNEKMQLDASTIHKWITSCELKEQVDTCKNAIYWLFEQKYQHSYAELDRALYLSIVADLHEEVQITYLKVAAVPQDRRELIISKYTNYATSSNISFPRQCSGDADEEAAKGMAIMGDCSIRQIQRQEP